ncbi:hypothetical protein [Marinobacter sp. S6332]|uniref:hypothetical protein n=1 Tax=Marinobacter sp. S6332 TaxID=2926403 RepID=UPI001FF32414|nr:hypothetical protein [Marinobacter sp. S6332]MCK0165192.1 hypothetical protein [Marinobacter sp. S6332]
MSVRVLGSRSDWRLEAAKCNTLGAGTGEPVTAGVLFAVVVAASDRGLLDSGYA